MIDALISFDIGVFIVLTFIVVIPFEGGVAEWDRFTSPFQVTAKL